MYESEQFKSRLSFLFMFVYVITFRANKMFFIRLFYSLPNTRTSDSTQSSGGSPRSPSSRSPTSSAPWMSLTSSSTPKIQAPSSRISNTSFKFQFKKKLLQQDEARFVVSFVGISLQEFLH